MKYLFLCLGLSISILRAQVATFSGTVRDFENGSPLPYASIQVPGSKLGTLSDNHGRFTLLLDSAGSEIRISLVGYEARTFTLGITDTSLVIELMPVSYETKTIIVPPLTWAEKFISNAILASEFRNNKLNFYKADAYSKTVFTKDPEQIIGLIEAISEVSYLLPDQFQEKLIAAKIPPHIKNIPYSSISINQRLNVHNELIKLQNIYFVSPLSRNALSYYDYSFKERTILNKDTIVTVYVRPKFNRQPLFEGELIFNEKMFLLRELKLNGNEQSKTSVFDSIKISQKYGLIDSLYNLPVFSKCSVEMNYLGLNILFQQEYTFTNYKINNVLLKPVIPAGDRLIESIIPEINVDSSRVSLFKSSLSMAEQRHQDLIDSVFVRSPLLKKLFLLSVIQLPPLLLDEAANIGKINIAHISNWYHFNKAEGHYFGVEYKACNNELSRMFFTAGYGFTSRLFAVNLLFNWKHFNMNINTNIANLGNFSYNKNLHTFEALIKHVDNNNYYLRRLLKLDYRITVPWNINLNPFVLFEEQEPVETVNEFSVFNRDKKYVENYKIKAFRNNQAGLCLSYCQVPEENIIGNESPVKGRSYLNMGTQFSLSSVDILNSTEDGYNFHLNLHLYQYINSTVNFDLLFFLHKQSIPSVIQNMNFVSSNLIGQYPNSALVFFTLSNYQFYVQDYLRLKAESDLIKFPDIMSLRIKFAVVYSFLKSINRVEFPGFSALQNDFHEFGLAVKGISLLNVYLLKNNISGRSIYFRINLSL